MARPISYDPSTVLDHAIDLFWDRGFGAVSVDDLVRITGLNRHSLYGRYGNKFGLLKAALEHYSETSVEAIRQVLSGPGTALQCIELLLSFRDPDCHNGFDHRLCEQGCLGLRIGAELRDSNPELEQLVHARMVQIEELIAGAIRRGQAEAASGVPLRRMNWRPSSWTDTLPR